MSTPHATTHDHDLSLDAAVEFLNTLELESGQLVDHLHRPEDARAWFVDHAVIHETVAGNWTAVDLARVRAVRDGLRDVVDAVVEGRSPASESLDLVNNALESAPAPRLELDGSAFRFGHHHGNTEVADALAALATPIITELASGRSDRFRTCANDTCRRAFYDASPTGRRRWCDMRTCGNRAKAARHRERARAAPDPAETMIRPEVAS